MTELELERYFGVQTFDDVPEYELIEPYLADPKGDFVSHMIHDRDRYRRELRDSSEWNYVLNAFDKKMHLKLKRNTRLVRPGLELETRHENEDVTRTPVNLNSYFHGKIASDPDSFVAVGNAYGLIGMLRLSRDTFFIHPVPDHLTKHVTTQSKPHLIYKKSSSLPICQSDMEFDAADSMSDINGANSSSSLHKFLQVELLADENVAAKHGNDTADFLLVLANIVAGMFRDHSIGRIKVNYVVSRLVIITNKELNVNKNASNRERMGKLNAWIEKHKPRNKSDPLYLDVTTLIHVIVSNVNGYAGLQTAGVIAHETAHNFGVRHDNNKPCKGSINIMAEVLPGGKGAFKWSACSKSVLQTFLSGPGSQCLDDLPQVSIPTLTDKSLANDLPGHLFDADAQCRFIYGRDFRQCPHNGLRKCSYLYCSRTWSVCVSLFAPPADGTKCGPRHSAHIDLVTGVLGGISCLCQPIQKVDCPLPSYRDIKCNKTDPGSSAHFSRDSCRLACIKHGWFVRYHGTVANGNRCNNRPESFDVCIDGKCRAVGCDHVLESGTRKDRCGICGGNGDTCIEEKSEYTKDHQGYSYDKADTIVVLPVGTANAIFKKRGNTYNNLGIQDNSTGTYIIALPSLSRSIYYKGTRINYKHSQYKYADSISLDGPTQVPLRVVFVWLYEANQGVDFQYYRPLLPNETSQFVPSKWIHGNWSTCSEKCGQGVSTREVSCVRSDDETPASFNSCSKALKPTSQQICNNASCNPEWYLTEWNTCSKTCGNGSHFRLMYCRKQINASYFEKLDDSACDIKCSATCGGGLMTRKLECVKINEHGMTELVHDHLCRYAAKPLTETVCNVDKPCDPPPEMQVACFVGADKMREILGYFTDNIPWENTNEVVQKCARLAHQKGYKLFALGKNGLCLSDADVQNIYHASGTYGAFCRSGIGIDNSIFVYTFAIGAADHQGPKSFIVQHTTYQFVRRQLSVRSSQPEASSLSSKEMKCRDEPLPVLEPLGCYHDNISDRALPDLYANVRDQIIWTQMNVTVNQCARVAQDIGYEYFAVQFYGECFGGMKAGENYDKYGKSTNCWKFDKNSDFAVGSHFSNFVYRIKQDRKIDV
ncbi:A disintegrin and metalloproteinase with thrombospondin motifs 6 [Acropora cervicornis]|uniref:A disintegrin and metalloproteinase with thrombospondin motifs 6 n=1 Tax=Acropora cervicornis TaxID=6130 RepID=A0AAD9V3E0_ACRCE|nr:A disintegrin and metalloproteinase with thrombospondin motifs 6 [Acropora cervicornis]